VAEWPIPVIPSTSPVRDPDSVTDMASPIPTWYIAVLLLAGLAFAIYGSVNPLGGGLAVLGVGSAAVGAGLVLLGLRLARR
jgi:hypothetical protein